MLENLFEPNMIRIIAAFTMLGIASVIDLKKREINDILWIGFAGLAVVMIFTSPDIWQTAKVIGISMIIAPVSLAMWRFGMFGGADALCLIVLAGLAPMATMSVIQITPLTTLTNAAILSTFPLLLNFGRNILAMMRKEDLFKDIDESTMKKAIAIFLGYRAKNPKHSFPMEEVVNGQRRFDFSLKHAEKATFCNDSGVWVTPGIPYLFYIAAGFLIQVFYGDIIFNIIHGLK